MCMYVYVYGYGYVYAWDLRKKVPISLGFPLNISYVVIFVSTTLNSQITTRLWNICLEFEKKYLKSLLCWDWRSLILRIMKSQI